MNKDSLKLKGRPAEIPNVIREDLPKFFKEMGYKVGVEIGTARGLFAELFVKEGLKLYCVDPWENYSDYEYDKSGGTTGNILTQYEEAKQRLAPYDNCILIRDYSMKSLDLFEDESIDFVYIDGNHGFKYVTEDIFEWSKKVKKGGCISGHDYIYTNRQFDDVHAKYVVDAYTKAFRIDQWYVLGRSRIGDHKKIKRDGVNILINKEGEIRNPFRSWLWIKK